MLKKLIMIPLLTINLSSAVIANPVDKKDMNQVFKSQDTINSTSQLSKEEMSETSGNVAPLVAYAATGGAQGSSLALIEYGTACSISKNCSWAGSAYAASYGGVVGAVAGPTTFVKFWGLKTAAFLGGAIRGVNGW